MSDKIPLKRLFAAIDRKDRNFYDGLTDEERKSFTPYLALRYASAVKGSGLMQTYYLRSCNVQANKGFFSLGKEHAKLQWLLLTTISPGAGLQDHEWIPVVTKKQDKKLKKKMQALMTLYPVAKIQDLELMSTLMSDKEVDELIEEHGIKIKV